MGPGDASGWYWTENTGRSLSADALDRAVEQRAVGDLDRSRQVAVGDREAMVLAGDLDLAGGQVLDRMVGAVVAERHLLGAAAQRQAEHLVAEADPEHRLAAVDQLPDLGHGVDAGGRGIAGTVGQQDPVRRQRQHLLGGRRRGHHGHPAAEAGEAAQDVALHAVVDGDHVRPPAVAAAVALAPGPAGLVPAVALAARDLAGEVHALEPGPGLRPRLQRPRGRSRRRAGRPGPRSGPPSRAGSG